MTDLCDIGVLGLATMGANLARNAAHKGFRVAVYNRNHERTATLIKSFDNEGKFVPARGVEEFAASLRLAKMTRS